MNTKERLSMFVGMFVKVMVGNNIKFGMVDELHHLPNKELGLGFVYTDKDNKGQKMYVAHLIHDEKDIIPCKDDEEQNKCIASAIEFWDYEVESLKARIAHEYEIDDPVQLECFLRNAEMWKSALHKKYDKK